MAALLINKLSSTNKPSRRSDHDDLKALMNEISDVENNSVEFEDDGAKVDHKQKLLCLLARTVLERLASDDPFMDVPKLVSQASDALDIFLAIVKEVPSVLVYRCKPGLLLQGRGHEPLWLWLFPRILALLGRRHCDCLAAKIRELIFACFQVVSKSPKLWNLTSLFFSYLQECITSDSDVILPSDAFNILMYCLENVQENDEMNQEAASHCTYVMQSAESCLAHVTGLLAMLVDISMESALNYDATIAFQDYLAWMFESFLTVRHIQNRWRVDSALQESCKQSEHISFQAIHALLSTLQDHLSSSIRRKGFTLLSILCADLLTNHADLTEDSLTSECKRYSSICSVVLLNLVPALQATIYDEASCNTLDKDFKNGKFVVFESVELDDEFRKLELEHREFHDTNSVPAKKRRKLATEPESLKQLTSKLYPLLGTQNISDLTGLAQVASLKEGGISTNAKCHMCERGGASDSATTAEASCKDISDDAVLVFSSLIASDAFQESRRPRVFAMIALKRFTVHFSLDDFIDFNKSSLGQWCLQSLNSSVRELRIAAGRTLPGFLRGGQTTSELMMSNRIAALTLLRTISDQGAVHLQETCILAWGQVGRTLNDDELNLVLHKLVEYLGHSNPIISGVAFNEILTLAKASEMTVERMFSPFWDTIAIVAVKELLVKPQITQSMVDLLGTHIVQGKPEPWTVQKFLVLTQSFTLPYLVYSQKIDVIRRIALANEGKDEKWPICYEPSNLMSILAFLLVHDVADMETFIMQSLRATSSTFKDANIIELMRAEPATIALILLKAAGDVDESKKSRIRLGLSFLANWAPAADLAKRKTDPIGSFLEQHILGLVDKVSKVVYDVQVGQSISEKKRCVKAIEEMIVLGKTSTRTARPQMCACLQSALALPELQALAFSAWEKMLMNLEDDDVELMLENTFSTVIQRWETFDKLTRKRAQNTMQYLLKNRTRLIRNTITNLPSLAPFPELADVEEQLKLLRTPTDEGNSFEIFSRRLRHENSGVVFQALMELKAYLKDHQAFLQASAVSEQPDIVVGILVRSILDCCVKFSQTNLDIAGLSAECIGLIGCLDPNRVECVREQREMVVTTNFHDPGEATDFVLFLLEEVVVKAFLSSTDTGVQGFLSFLMQELLEKCDFKTVCVPIIQNGERNSRDPIWAKWRRLPPSVQDTLAPFLSSKYSVTAASEQAEIEYPIFRPDLIRPERLYDHWLKTFVLDLLYKPVNANSDLIFTPLRRAIRIRDHSVASFLLPYVTLYVIVEGLPKHKEEVAQELLRVLEYEITTGSKVKREEVKACSEAVFRVLDYFTRWKQARQAQANEAGKIRNLDKVNLCETEIVFVDNVLDMLPAEVIARRAVECKSYSRALFYWEQHIRQLRVTKNDNNTTNTLLERLQDIYTQIDEPDGIEGISAHLHVLDIDQQILGHRKAGRWAAAQSWYEIQLAEDPDNTDVQVNLLTCLKESGQHDVLLNYVEGMNISTNSISRILPFAAEASWATRRWSVLRKYTSLATRDASEDFNVSVGSALLALHNKDLPGFASTVKTIRERIACSMSMASSLSIGACHDILLKFHVLTELEMIAGTDGMSFDQGDVLESLDRRLAVLGAYLNDKQYLLGIRRAALQLSSLDFTKDDVAGAWLTSARLARKGNAIHQSFNAVLHASQLGDQSATIEHARLLWLEGHHRKAIQNLKGAIDGNAFISHNRIIQSASMLGITTKDDASDQQNFLTARAHLLLAKWQDSAGQTSSSTLRTQYQLAAKTYTTWEKVHYYLGRHYNKLLESEKSAALENQSDQYLRGDLSKLVIESYLRSLIYGTKYIYQTLPRLLTLWLELGAQVVQSMDSKTHPKALSKESVAHIAGQRKELLAQVHARFNKYIHKLPAYVFYTAFPQIIARIAHPNAEVYKRLQEIIYKIVSTYPQQAIWSLLAVSTSIQSDRKARGISILQRLRNGTKKSDAGGPDMKFMIKMGERLTSELLMVCNSGDFHSNRTVAAKLSKDLQFNPKTCLPSPLAVPVESVLTATLPTLTDKLKEHKAFSRDVVTITTFLDDVLVLSSLQKPRKLTARGSDGKLYGLMCKPKDDLRKDQRLMEFNSMINRSLKRDAESSRRQLYIKTYAVTPLNEECGIIEWVEGLKTLRDILLVLYKNIGISPNYKEIETLCDEAVKGGEKLAYFTEKVLGNFPPVFHLWFVQQFPEPSTWFAARLRYTRSCAVMSMIGTILGLGDRHGENILFEEGNGGTFHVDFNCLFEKGLTFARPERVPFRLTHNMVDAMGIYGYHGPFRKSSELTLKLLRQHEETLMTILEAFIYDPTLDLLANKPEKKRREGSFNIPQTAQGVLDQIQRKVKGLPVGENVPLSVEGQVDELIEHATNVQYLAGMYIGWCSFF
ncbi:protein kinase-like protein rad3 [Calycina marina]|uniref:Serine/threonine-protein kinase MEC1 n=1 Tax=Calycina marina TaxID=1763456 RepID=A0A9P8CDY8_9HELO|nr:protein kinase-like protein rad3 [Calycina marina]